MISKMLSTENAQHTDILLGSGVDDITIEAILTPTRIDASGGQDSFVVGDVLNGFSCYIR